MSASEWSTSGTPPQDTPPGVPPARNHGGFSTCSELLSGRWTASLITEYLGDPDYLVRSTAGGCLQVVRYFRFERVESAENSEAWQQAAHAARARCAERDDDRGANPIEEMHRACDVVSASDIEGAFYEF
jgi:hypothetical protein